MEARDSEIEILIWGFKVEIFFIEKKFGFQKLGLSFIWG